MKLALCLFALLAAAPAWGASHTVRNTDDSGDGSLREALQDAVDGDTIVFGSGVRGEIALESLLDVDSNLSMRGPGAGALTLRSGEDAVMEVDGTVTITGVTIAGGETGIELKKGKLTLIECVVRASSGDGIANRGGRLTLVRTLVALNRGIGIANASGAVTCVNSTVADNSGAGIALEEGTLTAASCTIARNGGTGVAAGNGQAMLQNTVLANNAQGCAGDVRSSGHNLTDDLRCAFGQTGDQTSTDPRLSELTDNGGPSPSIALTGGSPAIDAGDPAGCADPSTGGMLTIDQRGARRPGGPRCDVGAFETQPAIAGTVINRILALVDGEPVTVYELKDFAAGDARLKQALSTDPAPVLDLLITKRLIEKEVQKQGINVTDADVDRYVANIRERNKIDDLQLEAALAQQGLTRERYRAQVREELERAQLINREIRGKVSVSPEEIERYYKEHESGGGNEAQVTISQIFLKLPADAPPAEVEKVESRADAIYEELQDGADFAEVARRESEDGAAKDGGNLGSFKLGEMRKDLEQAVSGLDPGEFSQPVRGNSGLHIVRLDQRVDPDATVAVPPAKAEEIKEQLYAKALEDRYTRWLREDLRQRHHVEIRP